MTCLSRIDKDVLRGLERDPSSSLDWTDIFVINSSQ